MALTASSVQAAGGSSVPSASPADEAADAYNRGIKSRDKAWEFEEEAASSQDAAAREKLLNKAQKEYRKAIRAFSSAAEANPRMYQAFSSLGYALRKTGDYEQSLEAYEKALEIAPDYTEAIEYRAEAFLGLNRLEDAQEAYLYLFRNDRQRADELLTAMQQWVTERISDPEGLDAGVVEEFASWVEERAEVAGNTASLTRDTANSWSSD
jgi:tetratricopeptide (TPR) repeat protein